MRKSAGNGDGVRQVVFTNCCFSGGLRCKLTAVLTNMVELMDALGGRRCEGTATCERTGLPHRSWRPEVVAGEIVGYPTEEEAEYPDGLCEVAAGAILEWVDSHGKGASCRYLFTEVFAGARAPLTRAVERAAESRVSVGWQCGSSSASGLVALGGRVG